ncbi:MAG: thymidine phosphorylase [candidate division WOR-3 bacterium]
MTAYEIILKKKLGQKLSDDEIEYIVSGYTNNVIPDYQFSAFLMAVYFQGMSFEETTALTNAMLHSGKIFDLTTIPNFKVDKHSTGGVGDKVSLILAPLVASLSMVVPMVSGRGLGHTGGTLDKLESIPGFKTDLTEKKFISQLKKIGVAMIGQTKELVPADKKIYALRDVTATVDSIPLIAASIMSKKLAEGIDGLVLDVKTGSGAFMKDYRDAETLAKVMIAIGKRMHKKVGALITNMEQPLGYMVGNALEVIESIECLKGNGPADLMQITTALAYEMLLMSKKYQKNKIKEMIDQAINDGLALAKFREIIKCQGGDERIIDDYQLLPQPKHRFSIPSPKSGYIQKLDALTIGLLSVELGCGRKTISDKIDYSAGFIFKKKIGDKVKKGEILVDILANDRNRIKAVSEKILNAYKISNEKIVAPQLILSKIY